MARISEAVVGNWVRRTKVRPWHMAQSIFIREVLTKCGKYMAERNAKGQELETKMSSAAGMTVVPSAMCMVCFPNAGS